MKKRNKSNKGSRVKKQSIFSKVLSFSNFWIGTAIYALGRFLTNIGGWFFNHVNNNEK